MPAALEGPRPESVVAQRAPARVLRSTGRPYTVANWGGQYQKGFESACVTPVLQTHQIELRSDTIEQDRTCYAANIYSVNQRRQQ